MISRVAIAMLFVAGCAGDDTDDSAEPSVLPDFVTCEGEVCRITGTVTEDFELDAAFVYLTGRSQVAPQTQDVFVYDLRAVYNFTSSIYLSGDYELTQETNIVQEELETAEDLLVHTLFARLTYRL